MSHRPSYRTARLEAVAIAALLREATVRASMLCEELDPTAAADDAPVTIAEVLASALGDVVANLPDLADLLDQTAARPAAEARRVETAMHATTH